MTSWAVAVVASLAIAVALALASLEGISSAASSSSVALIAVDTDPSGNAPRTVGAIDECLSTTVGQPADIDIVVPSPGIPADRGIAAFQFTILYDPAVVWISADDSDMLLAQAAGSNVIPIAEPKPDKNGVYQSWGVDFGTSGIEPAGASETGPGVIARITLLPQSNGLSPLILSGVLVIDDASERISLESVQSATIHVGEPCSGQGQTSMPTPTPSPTPTPTPAPTPTPTPAPTPTPGPHASAPVGGAATGVGSLAPTASSIPAWAAIISMLGGASLLIAGKLGLRARARGDTFTPQDQAPHPPDSDGGEP